MLEKAISIAVNAHYGQDDRNGQPYILHVLRVMLRCRNEEEQITGALHDLIEDTDWTIEGLRREGFADDVLNAVNALTRRDNEQYDDYIKRLSYDPVAVNVKIADLEDNMDLKRVEKVHPDDLQRLNRYLRAYKKLQAVRNRVYVGQSKN
jgi:(p)ppGpp synthase/HD superfamily hydrolase